MSKEQCPKCGFNLTDTYCVRCGYNKNIFITDITKTENQNDIERYMKDHYQKVVYNKNIFQIFILGPLYFSYFKFYFLGFSAFIIEFLIYYFLNYIFSPLNLGIEPLVIFYLINRTIYLIIANKIILNKINKKITQMKQKNSKSFKVKIYKEKACSIHSLFISIIFVIIFLILFIIWYRIQNGTLSLL